ncbi:hypothetical protein SDC49_19180 [Lactobacillus sp. R2/2]|nr:hypothetical protein [Lactobacillus sp. R2/2]
MPWTIVDKGDSRVSLALIDDAASYKKFPFHFEVILTYAIDGNKVDIKFYLKNNSHKDMPFSVKFTVSLLMIGLSKLMQMKLKWLKISLNWPCLQRILLLLKRIAK